jgi:hypothetical protein
MSVLRRCLACVAVVIVLGALNAACARPTKTIAFQGDSVPIHGGLIVELDVVFTAGSTQEGAQYPFDTATPAPFIRFQIAEVGTVSSYTLRIHPIEPGQVVTCLISINGLIVDQHKATYPKFAICKGPPV